MKLDRNENADGGGKYALINLRRLNEVAGHVGTFQRWTPAVQQALDTLEQAGALEWGQVGTEGEFFAIKLKDRHAPDALFSYSDSVREVDDEFADEVSDMAARSGEFSPFCKDPD